MKTKFSVFLRLKLFYQPGIDFYRLEAAVYPPDQWPRYYRYSVNGGPPGGRWSFVASLKRHGLTIHEREGGSRYVVGRLTDPKEQK